VDWPARLLLAEIIMASNVAGAVVVISLALWVLQPSRLLLDPGPARMTNLVMVPAYLLLAIPSGILWATLGFRAHPQDGRRERSLVLYGPLRLSIAQGVGWFVAAVLFGTVNAQFYPHLGIAVAETVLIGGISTSALSYLLAERILRRSVARVLDGVPPRLRFGNRVAVRLVLFWALGTAVPVSGLLAAAAGSLVYQDFTASQLAFLVLVVGGAALVAGFLTTVGAAHATADPVRAVRQALRRVEQGDLSASVAVYDGSELGQLQAGFNNMAAGLRERDRIRELFGRQVGQQVASVTAAAPEVRLGGEVRQIAVLFVDLIGSTSLAAERAPEDVVALLNRFFAVVVSVVEANSGWINKFEGDAALAIFGAPYDLEDPAGHALAAGRVLAERLAAELPDARAGIGVSAGEALAGYVGDPQRYEYTVIGDPVNEAARLTELAKSAPGQVLASGTAVTAAGGPEAARWLLGDAITLRGRSTPTRLAGPIELATTDQETASAG
jgi:adenylate cyclase